MNIFLNKVYLSKKKLHVLIFILCIILGLSLRFYKLTTNPPGLHGDELGTSYNAYSLLTTGRDEYNFSWPLTFRNDFSPFIYYITLPFVLILGPTDLSSRLPSVFAGIMLCLAFYALTLKLFKNKKLAMLVAYLIIFSSWHIRMSRLGLEMIWALLFQIIGCFLLLSSLPFNKRRILYAYLFFSLSMFAYQTAKMTTPLILAAIIFLYFKYVLKGKLIFLITLTIMFIVLPVIVYLLVRPVGQMRFLGISVFTQWKSSVSNPKELLSAPKIMNLAAIITHNYIVHFDPRLLFFDNSNLRYVQVEKVGIFYFWQFIFIPIGLIKILKNLKSNSNKVIIFWIIISPIPASLTTGVPFANIGRALMLFPAVELLCAIGILEVYKISKIFDKDKILKFAFLTPLILFGFYNFLYQYFILAPTTYATFWGAPLKQSLLFLNKYETENEKVIITNTNAQSYMYFLFYTNKSPAWLHQQEKIKSKNVGFSKIGKYDFRPIDWNKDQYLKNVFVLGTAQEIPESADGIIFQISDPKTQLPAYRITKR